MGPLDVRRISIGYCFHPHNGTVEFLFRVLWAPRLGDYLFRSGILDISISLDAMRIHATRHVRIACLWPRLSLVVHSADFERVCACIHDAAAVWCLCTHAASTGYRCSRPAHWTQIPDLGSECYAHLMPLLPDPILGGAALKSLKGQPLPLPQIVAQLYKMRLSALCSRFLAFFRVYYCY